MWLASFNLFQEAQAIFRAEARVKNDHIGIVITQSVEYLKAIVCLKIFFSAKNASVESQIFSVSNQNDRPFLHSEPLKTVFPESPPVVQINSPNNLYRAHVKSIYWQEV
jgi:hypothetical protein